MFTCAKVTWNVAVVGTEGSIETKHFQIVPNQNIPHNPQTHPALWELNLSFPQRKLPCDQPQPKTHTHTHTHKLECTILEVAHVTILLLTLDDIRATTIILLYGNTLKNWLKRMEKQWEAFPYQRPREAPRKKTSNGVLFLTYWVSVLCKGLHYTCRSSLNKEVLCLSASNSRLTVPSLSENRHHYRALFKISYHSVPL